MAEPHPDAARTTLVPGDLERASPGAPGALNPLVGLVIDGQFRLLSAIGVGGMGSVWLADQLGVGRRVVLKFLHRGGNPAAVERFRREAQAVATLNHPNIVQIYVTGAAELPASADRRLSGGLTPYLAMEYVDGVTLRAAGVGGMPAPRAIAIMEQVVSALVAAHSAGIVHRDLKPENVMLTERWGEVDVVKVLDFGIAKLTHGTSPALTQAGSVFGTPRYMSPEQAKGEAVDARSDLYAVGVMLYELLCGAAPFQSDSALELMAAHANSPVPAPSQAFPSAQVPPELERLLLRALEKRPEGRFESALALRDALRALLPQGALTPPSSPALSRTVSLPAVTSESGANARARTRRWGWVVGGAAALCAVVGVGLLMHARTVERPPEAPVARAVIPSRGAFRERALPRRGLEVLQLASAAAAGHALFEGASGGGWAPAQPEAPSGEAAAPSAATVLEGLEAPDAPDPFDTLADQLVQDALGIATSALTGGKPAAERLPEVGVYPGATVVQAVGPSITLATDAPLEDVVRWYDARWTSGLNVIRLRDADSDGSPRLILSGALNPALPFLNIMVTHDGAPPKQTRITCLLRPGAPTQAPQ